MTDQYVAETKKGVREWIKECLFYLLPIYPFLLLYIPYYVLLHSVIGDWLGCDCPVFITDVNGYVTIAPKGFRANDFTVCFWGLIALCAVLLALFVMPTITKKQMRILYVLGIFAVSLGMVYLLPLTMKLC